MGDSEQWKGLWWVRRSWERVSASFDGWSLGRFREEGVVVEERKRRRCWEMEVVRI